MVIVEIPVQPLKTPWPKEVTELGMVNSVRPVQPEKVKLPMLVTVLGSVMLLRKDWLLNALLPMVFTIYPSNSDGTTRLTAVPEYPVIFAVVPSLLTV